MHRLICRLGAMMECRCRRRKSVNLSSFQAGEFGRWERRSTRGTILSTGRRLFRQRTTRTVPLLSPVVVYTQNSYKCIDTYIPSDMSVNEPRLWAGSITRSERISGLPAAAYKKNRSDQLVAWTFQNRHPYYCRFTAVVSRWLIDNLW